MKKLFLTALGLALAVGSALQAQSFDGLGIPVEPVNVKKIEAAIAKSDAEIADAKKAAKAATWIKRGDTFFEAEAKPVNGLYVSMPAEMLVATYGDAAPSQVTIGGQAYQVYNYEHFKAYVQNGQIQFFVANTVVDPQALDKAYEAYAKAYDVDAKGSAKKVANGLENLRNKSIETGGAYYSLEDYKASAHNFYRAYRASIHPAINEIDSLSLFYAGMSNVWGGNYDAALKELDEALALGYDNGGETHRLKFLAMYNLGQKEESAEVLKQGLSLYPSNEDLIDLLMRYYAENEGDPTSLIPMVQDAIAKNPTNGSLYQGLARIYDKLGQSDNAIVAIRKSVELAPDDFLANYLEGFFIIKKGDAMNEELNKMTVTSRAQYQAALDAVNAAFGEALAPLEKAYQINPDEIATVELLKNLTFRLREEPGMQEKNDKYNAVFNTMSGQ